MTDLLEAATCAICRVTTTTLPPPLTWSPSIEGGHRVWTCPDCARDNIRNIEGRIAPAWW